MPRYRNEELSIYPIYIQFPTRDGLLYRSFFSHTGLFVIFSKCIIQFDGNRAWNNFRLEILSSFFLCISTTNYYFIFNECFVGKKTVKKVKFL